ncbi:hypothetical protein EGT74_20265 [Chitinophaga lutea]|uniref:Transglutaminase domain-containing protein n=2 Tax=Chitinophaga lutea TaxID=2488634 RepID=A0A3N4PNF6_9BACT|nr:hypothetical protein EGT74_20265 [Chitinophaga lutea]
MKSKGDVSQQAKPATMYLMKNAGRRWLLYFYFACHLLPGCREYIPDDVESALAQSGENRNEIMAAIRHYNRDEKDSLKLRALYFLITNMGTKYAYNVEIDLDRGKENSPFDIFSFFREARRDSLLGMKQKELRALFPAFSFRRHEPKCDLATITREMLVENIDYAFSAWDKPWARQLTFEEFCEYLLPYRSDGEPLSLWRKRISGEMAPWLSTKKITQRRNWLVLINDSLRNRFHYHIARLKYIPFELTPKQIDSLGGGTCEDLTMIASCWLKSAGIPVVNDFTPAWGSGYYKGQGHSWLSYLDENRVFYPFNPSYANPQPDSIRFGRDLLPKVYRHTFKEQPHSLAVREREGVAVPGFLNSPNILDVTDLYIRTVNIRVRLDNNPTNEKYAYLGVFSAFGWKVVAYGDISNNTEVEFSKMGPGVLYMPLLYVDGELVPAGRPLIGLSDTSRIIFGNRREKRYDSLKVPVGLVQLKQGDRFGLFVWDSNHWEFIYGGGVKTDDFITLRNLFKHSVYIIKRANKYDGSFEFIQRPFCVDSDTLRVL